MTSKWEATRSAQNLQYDFDQLSNSEIGKIQLTSSEVKMHMGAKCDRPFLLVSGSSLYLAMDIAYMLEIEPPVRV